MKAFEQLENRILAMFDVMDQIKAENLSVKRENQELKVRALEELARLEKTLKEYEEKIRTLEEEKALNDSDKRRDSQETSLALKNNLKLEKSREMARIKVEEMLAYLDRLNVEA